MLYCNNSDKPSNGTPQNCIIFHGTAKVCFALGKKIIFANENCNNKC